MLAKGPRSKFHLVNLLSMDVLRKGVYPQTEQKVGNRHEPRHPLDDLVEARIVLE